MKVRKWLWITGVAISAVLLTAILWRLDWSVFVAELRRLRAPWLAAAIVFILTGTALRALRWNIAANVPLVSYGAFWSAAIIGLAVNQIYPLRAGEVLRIFALRRFAEIPLGRAATSALIDRLADVLGLGVSALLLVAVYSALPYAGELAAGTLLIVSAVLVALVALARGDRIWRRWITRWSTRMSARLHERVERFYSEALATAASTASPARLTRIVLLTAVIFTFDIAVAFVVLKAFDWSLPWIAPVTVLVFLAVGTSLPSAPGYAGVYQVACVLALALFGIREPQAVAYSVALQGCVLVTVFAAAGVVALQRGGAIVPRHVPAQWIDDPADSHRPAAGQTSSVHFDARK